MTALDKTPEMTGPAPETAEDTEQENKVDQVLAAASDMTFRSEQKYGLSGGSLNKLKQLMDRLEMNEEERGRVFEGLAEQREQMALYNNLVDEANKASDPLTRDSLLQEARMAIGLEESDEGPVWEETKQEEEKPLAVEKKSGPFRRLLDWLKRR